MQTRRKTHRRNCSCCVVDLKQTKESKKVTPKKQTKTVKTNEIKSVTTRKAVEKPKTNVIKPKESKKLDKTAAKAVLKQLKLTSPTLTLRQRKTKNYAESSIESTPKPKLNKSVNDNQQKIPIYKQQIQDEKVKNNKKTEDDLYQFDEIDSEENIKKKKRKRRIRDEDASLDEYNKKIEKILKNVLVKVKKRKDLDPNKIVNPNNNNNNNNNVEKAIDKVKPVRNIKKEAHNTKQIENNKNIKNGEIAKVVSEKPDDNDNNYEFDDDVEEPNNSPVHIIDNILLSPGKDPNTSFPGRPNANSTMIGNSNLLKPWRFNEINIQRNPYYLQVKTTALPCIKQEPIIDHTIVEKFDLSKSVRSACTPYTPRALEIEEFESPKTPHPSEQQTQPSKTPKQKLLTDFVMNSTKENCKTPQHNLSLFDEEQFSPIKKSSRKVLGNLTNVVNSTPIELRRSQRKTPKREDENHDVTYFGFESIVETSDVAEKKTIEQNKQVIEKEDHPYRFAVSIHDKTYNSKKKKKLVVPVPEVVEQIDNKEDDDDDGSSSQSSDNEEEEEHEGAGLFEDFHEDRPNETNMKKRKVKWLQTDDDKPKKRRKDVRTKEEEEEAERWAQQFNSMCKEVEEFPLEIE